MAKESGTRDIAKIASRALHPYVVLAPAAVLIAYQATSSPEDRAKWTVASLMPAYLLPILYMRVRAAVAPTAGIQMTFRSYFREKPGEVTFIACLFGIPSALILRSLDPPDVVMAAWTGLALTALLVAAINFRYRASIHMASLASIVTSVIIFCGPPSLIAGILIPVVGISRYQLGLHTPRQLITGFLVGLIVTLGVFRGFGILG